MSETGTGIDPRLQELLDKQAVREVTLRYFRGVDRRDVALVDSTFHPDATDTRGKRTLRGPGIAEAHAKSTAKSMRTTRHHVTTHAIEIDGDSATSEAYVLGAHVTAGEPPQRLQTASRYVDRLERRDGEWRVIERESFLDMMLSQPLEDGVLP